MTNILFKAWFGAFLTLLGSLLPTWTHQEKHTFARPIAVQMVRVVPAAKSSPRVARHQPIAPPPAKVVQNLLADYHCTFLGKATSKGLPYENASLSLWVTTPTEHNVYKLHTGADGSYSLDVLLQVKPNDPIDWEIKGQSSDLKVVEQSGRHIAMLDQTLVAVETSLVFAAD